MFRKDLIFYRRRLAIAIRVFLLVAFSVCVQTSLKAQPGKAVQIQTRPPVAVRLTTRQQRHLIKYNEAGAIMSLRTLFSAEATYQATAGNGDYGTLDELRTSGLIDDVLGEGHRYGYLFRIRREVRSSESQPSIEIVAVPRTYRQTGRRSFYMNETGVIRSADKNGAEATPADDLSVIDP